VSFVLGSTGIVSGIHLYTETLTFKHSVLRSVGDIFLTYQGLDAGILMDAPKQKRRKQSMQLKVNQASS
jgi:arginine exporter protein ArgO